MKSHIPENYYEPAMEHAIKKVEELIKEEEPYHYYSHEPERRVIEKLVAINATYESRTTRKTTIANVLSGSASKENFSKHIPMSITTQDFETKTYQTALYLLTHHGFVYGNLKNLKLNLGLTGLNTRLAEPVNRAVEDATNFLTQWHIDSQRPRIIELCAENKKNASLIAEIDLTTTKIKNELGNQKRLTERTQEILTAWGVDTKKIDKDTQAKLNIIIKKLEDVEKQEKLKEKHDEYKRNFAAAKNAFASVEALGQAKGNKTLQVIGSLGGSGLTIAYEYATLTGLFPGTVALTGPCMMFPIAGMALAAFSIFMALTSKSKGDDGLQKAFQAITDLIITLRKEMHERFDDLDAKLQLIYQNMLQSFEHLQSVLQDAIQFQNLNIQEVFKKLSSDLAHLMKITEDGQIQIRLDALKKLIGDIECHLRSDLADDPREPYELTKHIARLENSITTILKDSMLNAGRHAGSKLPAHMYHHTCLIQDKLKHDSGSALGFLSEYAKEQIKLPIEKTDLLNVDAVKVTTEHALAARVYLQQHYYKNLNPEKINEIKNMTQDAMRFVDAFAF